VHSTRGERFEGIRTDRDPTVASMRRHSASRSSATVPIGSASPHGFGRAAARFTLPPESSDSGAEGPGTGRQARFPPHHRFGGGAVLPSPASAGGRGVLERSSNEPQPLLSRRDGFDETTTGDRISDRREGTLKRNKAQEEEGPARRQRRAPDTRPERRSKASKPTLPVLPPRQS